MKIDLLINMLFQPAINGGHMNWYSITFSDRDEPKQKIQDVFLKYFTTSGTKEGMGVFARQVQKLNATTFYFTPATAAIAKLFGAAKCERPSSDGIMLLFGPDTCWNLFPDKA
jgi:hypothetical protein